MTQCLNEAEIQRCAGGSLPGAEQSAAEQHLLDCADCAARVAAVRPAVPSTEVAFRAGTRVTLADAPQPGSNSKDHSDSDFSSVVPARSISYGEPSPAPPSLDDFLASLSRSGLLSPLDIATLRERSHSDPAVNDVNSLIGWLVKEHKLTPYQAQILARGKGGALILGNYVILEKLGQGGMGTVFKARHRRMNRLVALKVLPAALANVPEAIARFQREVQAAATLHHPNIAIAHDADEAAGVHFLVMEFVDGPTLAAYVKASGPLPLAAAVRLAAQTARGLAAAHAAGIVHRDVKPSNLMVNRQGQLKILDLGLAQFHGEQRTTEDGSDVTRTGSVMGTVDYMAPEQARDSKSVDHRADMYSLGCTLYFLANGAPPAPPGSAAEKLLWHQTIQPPPLDSVCPHAPPRLTELVARLVAKDPEDRPATMDEIAAELEACAAEFPAGQAELAIGAIALAHDHTSSTMGGTGIQATLRELDPPRSSAPAPQPAPSAASLIAPPPPRRPRPNWLGPVCLIGGLATLAAVIAAPYINRPTAELPGGPSLPSGLGTAQVIPGDTPITKPPAASPHAPYQALLDWVFRNGGSISAVTGKGQQLALMTESTLPDQPLEIVGIRLQGTGVSDDELKQLAQVPGLRELSLADTKITDDGLAHLQALRKLTHLDLSQTGVTSAGLVHLARLAQLVELHLQETKVTDPGLTRLAGLAKLERLYLSDTAVTDVGIEQLAALPALKLVTLHGTTRSESADRRPARAGNRLGRRRLAATGGPAAARPRRRAASSRSRGPHARKHPHAGRPAARAHRRQARRGHPDIAIRR
jgi:serine/threonine protein kinase